MNLKKTRILDLLDQEWRKDDFDYEVREMKFKEQGIKILSQYVDFVLSNHPKVLEREMSFSFDIKDVTIKGSIDRIDEDRNGVKIIYKKLPEMGLGLSLRGDIQSEWTVWPPGAFLD